MAWKIELSKSAEKSIDKLGSENATRILLFLRQRLAQMENPRVLGAALSGTRLGAYWKTVLATIGLSATFKTKLSKF